MKLIKKINFFEPGGSFSNNPLLNAVEANRQKYDSIGKDLTNKAVTSVRESKQRADQRNKHLRTAEANARKKHGMLNDVARIQDNLWKQGYFGDIAYEKAVDGKWGKMTQAAYDKSRTKQNEVKSDNSDTDNTVIDYLKGTPLGRGINHTVQTYSNQLPKIVDEAKKGNYGKATASLVGIPVDLASSSPSNIFGYNMYTAPIKDIINSQYNRAVRAITGDQNYTAIKGQNYGKHDMSKGMWDRTLEMQQRVANGEDTREVAHEMAKRVDPNYDYTSAQLLFHPLNDTANYLWTIGGQKVDSGDYSTDAYDNNKNKTQSYLRSLEAGWKDGSSMGKQIGRAIRGFGGLVTSQDEDPDEQKQITVIPKQKKK